MDITKQSEDDLEALKKQIEDELESRKPKKATISLHRDKESNYNLANILNLTDKQIENFRYTGYEVTVDIEIDKEGMAVVTHFEGVELPRKVSI